MAILQQPRIIELETEISTEAQAALLMLDRPPMLLTERRRLPRTRYVLKATLHRDGPEDAAAVEIYTRDVNPSAIGFVTTNPLIVGERWLLHLLAPQGRQFDIPCNIYRSRQFTPGWYEVAAHFQVKQVQFAEYSMP